MSRRTRLAALATILAAVLEMLGLGAVAYAATSEALTVEDGLLPAVAIAVAFTAAALARSAGDILYATAQVRLETELREEISDAILDAEWQDFVDRPGHELQSAVLAEAPAVAQATITYARARAVLVSAALVLMSTTYISLTAALLITAFGLLMLFVHRRGTRGLGAIQKRLADENSALTQKSSVLVNGLRSLRLSPIQSTWRRELQDSFGSLASARTGDLLTPVRARSIVDVLAGVMILVVLLVQIAVSKSIIPGLVAMALVLRVVPRLQSAQQLLAYSRHAVQWLDRWEERLRVLQTSVAVRGRQGHGTASDLSPKPPRPQPAGEPTVLRLDNLHFAYRNHTKPVLQGISLNLHRGEWLALRGESGGGKSTLIDLIGGILTPSGGEVQLMGHPLHSYGREALYEDLVIVPQDVHLFGEEVDSVLSWGGRVMVDAERRAEVVRALGIDQMFLFADGGHTGVHIDELSRNISGGMRTRLAMARGLLTEPAVLILDETTSRLHPEAEAEIFAAVRKLRPDLAVMVVSHRVETTQLADREVVLSGGILSSSK